MSQTDPFMQQHLALTRRFFVQVAGGGLAVAAFGRSCSGVDLPEKCAKACDAFLKKMEYLTSQEDFGNVSRGDPRPYKLSDEKKHEVGLIPDTWQLEVVSDPENPAEIGNPLTKEAGNAFNWDMLMELAKDHAVSVPKIMTCNNIGRPLGMGFWEGVPLRKVIWMTKPNKDVRRVFYHGYHNDDPKQMFRSSLPVGRILEDPFDLPPVLLCYKLNGRLLNGERGGPVRMLVPEAYGFKSVKWLNRIVLSNLPHANDTYAKGNNDLDSLMKTFAHSLLHPDSIKAGEPIPITGYSQVGVSGLAEVQTLIMPKDKTWPEHDPYFTEADWTTANIPSAPRQLGRRIARRHAPAESARL